MTAFLRQHLEPPIGPGERYPLFTRLSIETTSTCTRRCSFCPVDQRPGRVETMDPVLFTRIVDQLADLRFSGVIQLFYINEPYLDKRIDERLAEMKAAIPRACVHITTNGEPLGRTAEAIASRIGQSLDAGANVLLLNAYDPDRVPLYADAVRILTDGPARVANVTARPWAHHRGSARLVAWENKTNPTGLHSWGGAVADRDGVWPRLAERPRTDRCPRPHRHLVIDYQGRVPLCCAMPPGAPAFADIRETSLIDAWESPEFYRYRHALQDGKRRGLCEGCVETAGGFPWAVRRVVPPADPL